MEVHQSAAPQLKNVTSAAGTSGLLDVLLAHASEGIVISEMGSGRVVRVNAAFAGLIGHAPEDLVGRPLTSLGLTAGAPGDGRERVEEIVRGDGGRRRVSHHSIAAAGDSLIATFVAEARRPESAGDDGRRASEERNRLVIEAVSDYGIFMLDPAGHVASWSPGAQRIQGYDAEEIIGQHFSAFYTPEDVAAGHPQHELRRAAAEGRYEESGQRVRKDGTRFVAKVTITPIRDRAGVLTGFAKVTHDDTARALAEAALRDSEARFRQLVETIDAAFVLRSVDPLKVLYASPSAVAVLGLPIEQIYADPMHLSALVHPEDRARAARHFTPAAGEAPEFVYTDASGAEVPTIIRASVIEFRIVRPSDGQTRWVRLKGATVRDDRGRLTGFATALEDVSAEIAMREGLRESQAQLDAFVQNIPAAVILTDREDRIVLVNAEACAIRGEPAAAMIGRPFASMVPEDPRVAAADTVPDARPAAPIEVDFVDAEGNARSAIAIRFPIVVDGEVVGRGRIGFDATELKRAERALRASEQRFRSLFENSIDGILLTTLEGDVLAANAAICAMLARSEAEIRAGGRPLIVDTSDERLAPALRRRADEGHMRTGLTLVRADGTRLPVDVTSSVFEDVAGEGRTSIIVRDMSEAVARETELRAARAEAEQANAAKSQFLSRMSHELRTPLNSVLGFGQLLGDQPLSERQARYVKRMMGAGRHLLGLIDEVLDISRLESGHLSLSPEVIGLAPAVAEAVALVEPLADERDIVLDNRLESDPAVTVLADVQRLKQVLLNVLANAIKYNRTGGSVTIALRDQDSLAVRLCITDTGPGIPAQRAENVFTPFDRLGAEETDIPGTGLGLAVSKSLLEAMGGAIGFEAAEVAGTTFWIELRRGDPAARSAVQAPSDRPLSHVVQTLAGRTVLLVEDNEANDELVAEALTPAVRLITAMQGQMGIELAHAHRPDLILLDLHLPDLTGEQVLASLKAHPDTVQIPIIIVSADAGATRQARLLAAGAEAYIPKPLDLHRLISVAADAVRRARSVAGAEETA